MTCLCYIPTPPVIAASDHSHSLTIKSMYSCLCYPDVVKWDLKPNSNLLSIVTYSLGWHQTMSPKYQH